MLEQLAVYDGPVYSGSAAMALYAGALGCTGAILAAANLEPELQRARRSPATSTRSVSLLDAHRIASFDSPHGLKRELHARYGTPPHCRHHASGVPWRAVRRSVRDDRLLAARAMRRRSSSPRAADATGHGGALRRPSSNPKHRVEADREAGAVGDRLHREQHAGHERAAVVRVVADR